jgi:hypothetical protein
MFDLLVAAADVARGAGAVGAWARVENAACARRLCAIADVLEARLSADGSAEREQWCIDNWDAVAAEVAAAQSVSLGVASHELMIAGGRGIGRWTDFLPPDQRDRVSHRVDPRLRGAGHGRHRIGRGGRRVGSLSVAKVEAAIDSWVDRYDPDAVRRVELSAPGSSCGGVR